MNSNESSRRRFLAQTAAMAGLATGAGLVGAKGQTILSPHVHDAPPMLSVRYPLDHITHFTPLQDYAGIITPNRLHFTQLHSAEFPDIDPDKHRLTIHGLVDRPLSFSMDDLKRLPSVSRINFVECNGNSAPHFHYPQPPEMGPPVQYIHGMTSCVEWTGVSFSTLLNEVGVKTAGTWLVMEGGDPGRWTDVIPVKKALDDCIVAYGQNGDILRREQGFPLRAIVPGWEAPFCVKYLKHIKVVDEAYTPQEQSTNGAMFRRDLGGKARWYNFQYGPKSVITRPSAGLEIGRGFVQITGLAWSGAGKIKRVEVSTDGGRNWRNARIEGVVLSKAHTRFNYDWAWDGQEAMLMSRCTDETGDVQPSLAELSRHWQIPLADWKKTDRPDGVHFNAIQPWKIARDGGISDAMFI